MKRSLSEVCSLYDFQSERTTFEEALGGAGMALGAMMVLTRNARRGIGKSRCGRDAVAKHAHLGTEG